MRAAAKAVPANILFIVFLQLPRLVFKLILSVLLLTLHSWIVVFDILKIGLVHLGKVHALHVVYFLEVIVSIVEEDGRLLVVHFLVAHHVLTMLTIFELTGLVRAKGFRVFLVEIAKLELLQSHAVVISVVLE